MRTARRADADQTNARIYADRDAHGPLEPILLKLFDTPLARRRTNEVNRLTLSPSEGPVEQ